MEHAIRWSAEKNAELKARHGFGFERVVLAISEGMLLDERAHPNGKRYAHQRQLIVEIDGYIWVVPVVIDHDTMFMKTFFPSRKAMREFFGGDYAKRKN